MPTEIEVPENVLLREQTVDDTDFIYDSWLRSYRKRADVIPYAVYYKLYQQILDRILNRAPTRVLVAAFAPRPEQIMGFIAYEPSPNGPIIHYVYVKRVFRGSDIGRSLLLSAIDGAQQWSYTFRPKSHAMFREHGGRYAPHLVRGDLAD